MGAVVLACGRAAGAKGLAELGERDGVRVHTVPARPGKPDVDALLTGPCDRVVVIGTDADLAAVVLRLLRTEALDRLPVGFVPVTGDSEVALTWGLPTGPARAVEVALGGEPERVPLIRDDNGGLLLGLGVIGPVRGVAYCDEARVLHGPAKAVRVTPSRDGAGLEVTVSHNGLFSGLFNRAQRRDTGRSFEIGCLPTKVICDGIPHERPAKRWTWYRHTEDLRLVRGM
jgi:hypothetical protein